MADRKKIVRRASAIAGSLLILVLVAVISLPWFINTGAIKERIIAHILQKTAGAVSIGDVDIALFPVPLVTINQMSISLPGSIEGTVETARVFTALMPLLHGEVRISKVQIARPVLSIQLQSREEEKSWSLEEITGLIQSVSLGSPSLTLNINNADIILERHSRDSVILKEVNMQADLKSRSGDVTVTLDRLSSKEPGFKLSGALQINPSTQVISMKLSGEKIDVPPVRKAALDLAGDDPVVRKIFDIVQGGMVDSIEFQSKGTSPEDLGKTDNIRIRGRLKQGRVFIEDLGLDFRSVDGDTDISAGILQGSNLRAVIAQSAINDGTITVGLTKGDVPLRIDARVSADLADVHAILKNIIKHGEFRRELEHIHAVRGTAEGRLVLGPSMRSVNPRIDISKMRFAAQYDRMPFPVEVQMGQFSYDEKGVSVRSLSGSAGNSSFSEMQARLLSGDKPYLQVFSGKADLDTAELHTWLTSYPAMKEPLREIASISGRLNLSSVAWEGPLHDSREVKFRAAGSGKNLVLRSSLLPDTLSVTRGKFDATSGRIILSDVHADMLDASFDLSFDLSGRIKDLQSTDLMLSGTAGPKTLHWMKNIFALPAYLRTDTTIAVSNANFSRTAGETAFRGNLKTQGGQSVDLDLTTGEKGLLIRKLALEDAASRALLSMDFREKATSFSFSGKLDTSTIAQLVSIPQLKGGTITGDFHARIDPEQTTVLNAEGRLKGEKIAVPWKRDLTLTIDSVALNADKNGITVESAKVSLPENAFSVNGSIAAGDRRLILDMDISSGRIIWKSLSRIFEPESRTEDGETEGTAKRLSVEGRLKVKADTLIIEKRPVTDVQAVIDMKQDILTATINHARYCNTIITGKVVKKGKELSLDLYPSASGLDLKPAIACISDMNSDISGRFDLDGRLTLKGTGSVDLRTMQGNLNFHAKEGRIYRFTLLFKILTFLNVTDLFRGRLPDFLGEGFAYDSFVVKGDIKNGEFIIKEADIDAPSVEITAQGTVDLVEGQADIRGKAAPFRTIDSLIRVMPWWKNSTLISFPFQVKGNLKNPEVSPEP